MGEQGENRQPQLLRRHDKLIAQILFYCAVFERTQNNDGDLCVVGGAAGWIKRVDKVEVVVYILFLIDKRLHNVCNTENCFEFCFFKYFI